MKKEKVTYYNFESSITDRPDEFGEKPVTSLLNFINHTEGKLVIGFNSNGGFQGLSRLIVDALNRNADRIELLAHTFVASAAFEIMWLFKGKKTISLGTGGMIHYGSLSVDMNDNCEVFYKSDKCYLKNVHHQKEWREQMAKEVLTTKEFKKFKKGKDIYIGYERMKRIFEND